MAYQQKEGDIAIYLAKEKRTPKSPDYTGKLLIDGKVRDVSLWIKSDTMLAGNVKDEWKPDYSKVKETVQKTQVVGTDGEDTGFDIPF